MRTTLLGTVIAVLLAAPAWAQTGRVTTPVDTASAPLHGTAAAAADNETSVALGRIVSYVMCFDGTNWDRCRSATTTELTHDGTGVTWTSVVGQAVLFQASAAAPTAVTSTRPVVPWGSLRGALAIMPTTDGVNLAAAGSGANGSTVPRFTLATDDELNDDVDTIANSYGTAGTADSQVVSVQGIASMTPIQVQSSGAQVATEATAVNILTSADFAAAYGTAGTPDSQVGTVQGAASMTPILTQPQAVATGGASSLKYTSAGATEDEHAVMTGVGTLYSITVTNTNAAARYLRCENDTAANTTPGSETPELDLAIPGDAAGAGFTTSFPVGVAFSTALTCWIVTGAADTDVAEVAANEIKIFYTFKQ